MRFRKILLGGAYYYLLLATTVSFFLFISAFNSVYDGNPNLGTFQSFINQVVITEGQILAYHLLALFLIIVFRRKQDKLNTWLYITVSILFFALFILPSAMYLASMFMDAAGLDYRVRQKAAAN